MHLEHKKGKNATHTVYYDFKRRCFFSVVGQKVYAVMLRSRILELEPHESDPVRVPTYRTHAASDFGV